MTYGAAAYAIGMIVHGTDHGLRGLSGDDQGASWPAGLQIVMAVLTVVVSLLAVAVARRGDDRAALATMVIGFGSGLVFLGIHMLPSWAAFTDSFVAAPDGAHVSGYSWLTASLGISAAFSFGITGLAARAGWHLPARPAG